MGDATISSKRKRKSENQNSVMNILLSDEFKADEIANSKPLSHLYISDLVPFVNHPFKLYDGDRLDDMVRSIKECGVLMPVIVRPNKDGTYEILSGHNRTNAAKLAGLKEIPVIIKTELSDDEARLIVTETNLVQRSFADLSHSERAIALHLHLEALKSANGGQGRRTDILNEIEALANPDKNTENTTSSLLGKRLLSAEKTGEKYGLSKNSVARYVRLTKLINPLLKRVDYDEIALYPAVSLSYLAETEQVILNEILNKTSYKVDMKKAEDLRSFSESKQLTEEKIISILSGGLNKSKKQMVAPPLKIKHKIYSKYFDADTEQSEIESIIDCALSEYFENHKELYK